MEDPAETLKASRPNQTISSDTPYPIKSSHFITSSRQEKFYILTMSDVFSMWKKLDIIWDIISKTISNSL